LTLSGDRPGFEAVVPVTADRKGWEKLYTGYRAHYGRAPDAVAAATVWSWIHAPREAFDGRIIRTTAGDVIGMIHFRDVPRPLAGQPGGYIDDIFVAETHRGTGVAEALVDAVAVIGRERGWSDIRWITSEDNARARTFYDRIANLTAMRTYEIKL